METRRRRPILRFSRAGGDTKKEEPAPLGEGGAGWVEGRLAGGCRSR